MTVACVRPVASLWFDPDFKQSADRRLVFIRFAGVPRFWRVDLDVLARSVGRDPDYDRENPSACGVVWSFGESKLTNAIADIKAEHRGRHTEVAALLSRAEARVALTSPSVDLRIRIGLMVDVGAAKDPTTASLAADTCRLLEETF